MNRKERFVGVVGTLALVLGMARNHEPAQTTGGMK
jgi:hypothetical protein